jgi:hypothetical protein
MFVVQLGGCKLAAAVCLCTHAGRLVYAVVLVAGSSAAVACWYLAFLCRVASSSTAAAVCCQLPNNDYCVVRGMLRRVIALQLL